MNAKYISNQSFKRSLLLIITLFNCFDLFTSINFYFYMDPTSMRCLGEYLTDKTLGKNIFIFNLHQNNMNRYCKYYVI